MRKVLNVTKKVSLVVLLIVLMFSFGISKKIGINSPSIFAANTNPGWYTELSELADDQSVISSNNKYFSIKKFYNADFSPINPEDLVDENTIIIIEDAEILHPLFKPLAKGVLLC